MIAVIACGNANRRDDGAGPEVMRALKAGTLGGKGPDVRLLDAGTDGMAVMFAARGCRSLIVIDACRSGSEPGAVFEVPGASCNSATSPRSICTIFAGTTRFMRGAASTARISLTT
ncbi:hydrogenase maturation protease [Methyloceanibacter superfactus]|uniref:hydrogenase maturation protease n=1 Tax=Methyloceanibacter superfactus TaxID=1774969 RepID=UPI000A880C24|nr:hydrogenase maturation protease [Methyloceanibacter superfactus]